MEGHKDRLSEWAQEVKDLTMSSPQQSKGVSVIGACVAAFPPRMRADLVRAPSEEKWATLEFVDRKMQNIGKAKSWLRHEQENRKGSSRRHSWVPPL